MTEEIEDLSLFTNLPPGFALHLLGRHAGLPLQQRGRVYISITTNDCEQKEGDPKVKWVALFAFLSFILLQWAICKKKIAILLNFKRIAIVCLESFYYL